MKIEIADINPSTQVLGPGNRYVIWTQGCPFNCFKCIAPGYKLKGEGTELDVEILVESILANNYLNGVTITGGEPLIQSTSLDHLVKVLRARRSSLNYILYTGFNIENLKENNQISLVSNVDLVISGAYIHENNFNTGLAGSVNQHFHYISDKLLSCKDQIENNTPEVELLINDDEIKLTGIPGRNILEIINQIT